MEFEIKRRWLMAMAGGILSDRAWPSPSKSAVKPAIGTAPTSDTLDQSTLGRILYPRTELEMARGVTPVDFSHPPGNPRRYGATGLGWKHDDTEALQNCINCNHSVCFHQGDIYGVTSITFPFQGPDVVDFNGAFIVGIATSKSDCIVAIKCSYTTFYGYQVFGLGNGSTVPNPNPNYSCATWWYNSAGGSQGNVFFGMVHSTCGRAVVYGALPGNKPTGGLQSENSIYGFRTVGCANPFLSNAQAGFVHFSEPIFYAGFESWTLPHATTARALENRSGSIFAQGGELQYAITAAGFAAELQGCILQGMNFETAPPILITGDGVQIVGGSLYNTSSTTSEFKIAKGVSGTLSIIGASLARGAGAGAFSRHPMIDATEAASSFSTVLQDTTSTDWAWSLAGANCRLVNGRQAAYRNHRMRITASDPHVYVIDNYPANTMAPPSNFDNLGYTNLGWTLHTVSGSAPTLSNSTVAGPPGYLASQLTLASEGTAQALLGDPRDINTMRATCIRVRPGELYWLSCWIHNSSSKNVMLMGSFHSLSGAPVSTVKVADDAAIGAGAWSYADGPLLVPDNSAYIAFGIQVVSGAVSVTDLRISRAG